MPLIGYIDVYGDSGAILYDRYIRSEPAAMALACNLVDFPIISTDPISRWHYCGRLRVAYRARSRWHEIAHDLYRYKSKREKLKLQIFSVCDGLPRVRPSRLAEQDDAHLLFALLAPAVDNKDDFLTSKLTFRIAFSGAGQELERK